MRGRCWRRWGGWRQVALTAKQQAFVDEYLLCWNAAQAARAAGYSEATARNIGHENLTKPDIQAEIQRRVSERAMSADEVLIRLAEHARGSMADFVTFWDGVSLPKLALEKAHKAGKFGLVKKLKYGKDGEVEFELYDAQAALVQLGKVHKLFVERQDVNATIDGDMHIIMDR